MLYLVAGVTVCRDIWVALILEDHLRGVGVFVFLLVYLDNQNTRTWVVPVLVHILTGRT